VTIGIKPSFWNVPRPFLTLNIPYIKGFKPIVKEFIGTPVPGLGVRQPDGVLSHSITPFYQTPIGQNFLFFPPSFHRLLITPNINCLWVEGVLPPALPPSTNHSLCNIYCRDARSGRPPPAWCPIPDGGVRWKERKDLLPPINRCNDERCRRGGRWRELSCFYYIYYSKSIPWSLGNISLKKVPHFLEGFAPLSWRF
jgi:hypothetical protein